MKNMHSYFGKKGRVDVDDLDAGPNLNEQEQEHVEEEIPEPPPPPHVEAATPPPVQRNTDDCTVLVVQRDPGLRCQI